MKVMNMRRAIRRCTLHVTLALFAGSGVATAQSDAADTYPSRTIRLVSPFAAGGTTDILGRLISAEFFPASGQTMVVENVSGAGGIIGAGIVARAAPDGYTLEIGGVSTHAIAGSLREQLAFDPVAAFEPVNLLAYATTAIAVHAQQPFQTLAELIDYAKAHPGQLAYSSAGAGSINHLTTAAFAEAANIELLHVPYRGGGPASIALVQGEVQVFMGGTALLLPQARAGSVRILAVAAPERMALLPDVPVIHEIVPDFQATNWYGILAPQGMDAALREKIWVELDRIMRQPHMVEKLAGMGLTYPGLTTVQFKAALHEDQTRWSAVIDRLNLSAMD